MAFGYWPLRTNELRLLKPVLISHESLAFEISHHPREAAPPYTAVSYTWGDRAATEPISINNKLFRVRVTLWSCLYYIGQAVKSGHVPCKHLWVDAICIDQNNNEEREAQVLVMDQIYRTAIMVSVWLGLPPMSEGMQDSLAKYREPIKTYDIEGFDWFDGMRNLSNRPYWRRIWVIQEFLLAQHVRLYCANTSMDWLPFRDLLARASGVHDTLSEDVNYMRSPSNHWAAWPLVAGRHPGKHPELQQSLYQLLITHAGSKCKDPRDRVFALLGLVTPNERLLLERFLPDYAMSEDNVVLIALCHVQLDVCGMERGGMDLKRLLWALGVDSESRRQRLIKRSDRYDYLGEEPPNMHWGWFDDDEDNNSVDTTWRNTADPVYDEPHFRHWDAEPDARFAGHGSCCSKRAMYAPGMTALEMTALLVVYLKFC